MKLVRVAVVVGALALVAAGCGDDDDVDTGDAGATTTTTTTEETTTTTTAVSLEQPAIWPAPEVVFDEPEDAAADFVEQALGVVPATLGEFMQGDSRSGEIEVLSPGEGVAATPVVRSVLFLRQLGPDSGWFVIGAANENVTIDEPETGSFMTPGPVTVEGQARGFEGTVVVRAFLPGGAPTDVDEVVTTGGSTAESEPYQVTLDLSSLSSGDVVALVVTGGTGLETDPGEFSAIPIVVT